MVLPITGPLYGSSNIPWEYQSWTRYRQAKPFDLPLPYEKRYVRKIIGTGNQSGADVQSLSSDGWCPLPTGAAKNRLIMKSYDKLMDQLRPQASLGAAVAEAGQSLSMIHRRLIQLAAAGRALLRVNPSAFMRALNLNSSVKPPSKRAIRRDMAGTWLEYSFGWAPLAGDIFTSCEVLSRDFGQGVARGNASERCDTPEAQSIPWGSYTQAWRSGEWGVRQGVSFRIDNPNLFLANSLGLVNPLTVAWELAPFSYVMEWLFNVQQVLSLGTDFLGVTVLTKYTTDWYKGNVHIRSWYNHQTYGYQMAYQARVQRLRELTLPTLGTRTLGIPGWSRALNQAATASVVFDMISRRKPRS